MIEIYPDRARGRCRLLVTGHAESGKEHDAVCAGVSALVSALVLHARSTPQRHLRYSMASGEVFLAGMEQGEGYALVMRGLHAIQQAYPGHLKICDMAVDDKCTAV